MIEFIEAPSPNFDARVGVPDILVLHYTGMKTGPEALDRLRDPNAPRVSSHYMVEEDGRVFRLVPEERRAWHAGVSYWKGQRNINGVSIGVEMVNPGHEFGYRPFPNAQIAAVIELVGDIRSRWQIPDERIVGTPTWRRRARTTRASCSRGSGWPSTATACGSTRRRRRASR